MVVLVVLVVAVLLLPHVVLKASLPPESANPGLAECAKRVCLSTSLRLRSTFRIIHLRTSCTSHRSAFEHTQKQPQAEFKRCTNAALLRTGSSFPEALEADRVNESEYDILSSLR